MLSLHDREWKDFFIEDIAEINSGWDIYEDERMLGNIPYISSSSVNNGICHFVSNTNKTLESGCISVNRNGSVGYAFYHSYKALYSNDTRKLRLRHPNKYVSIFVANQITAQRTKYSYGYKMGTGRLKRQKIMLPIDEQCEPDYTFMEQYIKEREQQIAQNYIAYIGKTPKAREKTTLLNEKQWEPFKIEELFNIYTGGDMIISRLKPGNIPLISHSLSQNGVAKFIQLQPGVKLFDCNKTISLADRGNFGALVQLQDFYIGTRVKALEIKDIHAKHTTKFTLDFICAAINKQAVKFSYGNNCTDGTGRMIILLPVDDTGVPDWVYMESYAKNLFSNIRTDYLQYKLKAMA